jgi:hypothetical protein
MSNKTFHAIAAVVVLGTACCILSLNILMSPIIPIRETRCPDKPCHCNLTAANETAANIATKQTPPTAANEIATTQTPPMDLMQVNGLQKNVFEWYRRKYKLGKRGYGAKVRHSLNWTDDGSEADYAIGITPRAMDSPEIQYRLGLKLLKDFPRLPSCMHDDVDCASELAALRENFHAVFSLWKEHCASIHCKGLTLEEHNFACKCLRLKAKRDAACLGDSVPPVHPLTTR